MAGGGDFADVFVEDRASTSATFDDGKVEEMRSGRSRGAGIRVVKGETTGFAHTSDLTEAGLAAAAQAASAAASAGGPGTRVAALTPSVNTPQAIVTRSWFPSRTSPRHANTSTREAARTRWSPARAAS